MIFVTPLFSLLNDSLYYTSHFVVVYPISFNVGIASQRTFTDFKFSTHYSTPNNC